MRVSVSGGQLVVQKHWVCNGATHGVMTGPAGRDRRSHRTESLVRNGCGRHQLVCECLPGFSIQAMFSRSLIAGACGLGRGLLDALRGPRGCQQAIGASARCKPGIRQDPWHDPLLPTTTMSTTRLTGIAAEQSRFWASTGGVPAISSTHPSAGRPRPGDQHKCRHHRTAAVQGDGFA